MTSGNTGLAQITVLLVEDNPADARLLREAVREVQGNQIKLHQVETLGAALAMLDRQMFDVVMLDLSLPDAEGLETLRRTHDCFPSVPIVVLTGLDDEALAVRAVREGAQDYLVKGQSSGQLVVRAMRYATERKRAVEALQQSERYYRALIENALDIITVVDPDGRIRYGSPSLERTLGYPQGSLNRTDMFDLIHPDDEAHVRETLQRGTEHPGTTQNFEFRMQAGNGTWCVLEAIGKGFEPGSSVVGGYVLNSRDVTQRKRSEEDLREANETVRALIEASPLAIYFLDLDGNVRIWNTTAENMFGFPAAEVLGRQLPVAFESDHANALERRLDAARSGQLAAGLEQRARCKDGKLIEVSVWNALVRTSSGDVTGIVEAIADTTERKRLEEQFRQAQKMEAVGRLAGGVAHDFNNLLTVITGYGEILLDQVEPGSSLTAGLEQVMKAADRATGLTRQLLAFSRKQMVQPKVVDPDALVTDMEPMLMRLLGGRIDLHIRAAARARVRVDPGNFEQVLVNLVVNARDAMSDGGSLRIETRKAAVGGESGLRVVSLAPGEYYVMDVTDTGTGMDDETLARLFEPFFTTKERGRGTGLGLSTSYGIVKQNKGEILVRSRPGEGSTFSIFLPVVAEQIDMKAMRGDGRPLTGAETILVAEDEDEVRTVVREMLRKQGYNVLAANGAAQAMRVAGSYDGHIDLLITDMVMPGAGGRELADSLRSVRPGVKVLYMSGYAESGIVHEGEIESGAAFLHKPFTGEEIARKVREVLDSPAEHEREQV